MNFFHILRNHNFRIQSDVTGQNAIFRDQKLSSRFVIELLLCDHFNLQVIRFIFLLRIRIGIIHNEIICFGGYSSHQLAALVFDKCLQFISVFERV